MDDLCSGSAPMQTKFIGNTGQNVICMENYKVCKPGVKFANCCRLWRNYKDVWHEIFELTIRIGCENSWMVLNRLLVTLKVGGNHIMVWVSEYHSSDKDHDMPHKLLSTLFSPNFPKLISLLLCCSDKWVYSYLNSAIWHPKVLRCFPRVSVMWRWWW